MLEYVFFDVTIRDKFVTFLRERGVEVECGDEEGCIAAIPEDLDDELAEEIDACYEVLLQETAALMEQGEDAMEKNVAGVTFQLADGTPCTVRLDPDLVARILNCVTMEEFRDMVQLIAAGVENPDNRPLCHT
ncbi:MAG TPA: hypothetical protein VGE50_13525 [Gammaproteobacteria bacterium]